MKKLIVLKGIPGSGKSTWAKEKCEKDSNYIRINRDDIRIEYSREYSKRFEKLVKKTEKAQALLALEEGWNVILDDTNFNASDLIQEIISEGPEDLEVEYKEFNTPLDECIKRDASRPKPVGEAVVRSFWNRYVKTQSKA